MRKVKVSGKYIIRDPERMGGVPTIPNTRIPICTILYLLSHGNSIYDIRDNYPYISKEMLKGALQEVAEIMSE